LVLKRQFRLRQRQVRRMMDLQYSHSPDSWCEVNKINYLLQSYTMNLFLLRL
jgi:hypothetical protein